MTRYATYAGERGRSIGAEMAEADDRLPMTRAIPEVRRRVPGTTIKDARRALRATFAGEWHHTGNRARRTDYYDVAAACVSLDPEYADRAEADRRAEDRRIAERELADAVAAQDSDLDQIWIDIFTRAEEAARVILAVRPAVLLESITRRNLDSWGVAQPKCDMRYVVWAVDAAKSGASLLEERRAAHVARLHARVVEAQLRLTEVSL